MSEDLAIYPITAPDVEPGPRGKHPLPTAPFLMAIVAPPGSGKTTMVINMLTRDDMYRGKFHNVFVISPTANSDPAFSAVKLSPSRVHHDYNDSVMLNILNEIAATQDAVNTAYAQDSDSDSDDDQEQGEKKKKKRTPPKVHSLLIVDDMGGSDAYNQRMTSELMRKVVSYRHDPPLSVIFLVQSYTMLPKKLRTNFINYWCIFKGSQAGDIAQMTTELSDVGPHVFQRMYSRATAAPHGFLYIDKSKCPYRYYANFQRELDPNTI